MGTTLSTLMKQIDPHIFTC